ncbi:hypothetical protein G7046_g8423 [Stylonectria norvegica]|nr:hypothetical protein G7046_g8423 [Stylonectria norvegica]
MSSRSLFMELDPRLRHGDDAGHGAAPINNGSAPSTTDSPAGHRGPPRDDQHHHNDDGVDDGDTPDAPSAAGDEHHDMNHDPDDPKRQRACEACRGLKVRCEPDPNDDGPCKRCKKAGRNCVVTVPTRKRQKKTDSRVAELEKKIDALTASLQARTTPLGSGFNLTAHPPVATPRST